MSGDAHAAGPWPDHLSDRGYYWTITCPNGTDRRRFSDFVAECYERRDGYGVQISDCGGTD